MAQFRATRPHAEVVVDFDAARAALKAKDSYSNKDSWDAKPAKPVARSRKGLKVSGS